MHGTSTSFCACYYIPTYCLGLCDSEDKKCTWLEGFGWVATFFVLKFMTSSNKLGKKPMGTLIYNSSQYKIVHSLPIA